MAGFSEEEWLALNIYYESRGEHWVGRAAVALVTINRVDSSRYPDTIKGVVTQPYQFSWYNPKKSIKPIEYNVYEECLFISKSMIYLWKNGYLKKYADMLNLSSIKWYHNTSVKPKWSFKKELVVVIGNHHLYR